MHEGLTMTTIRATFDGQVFVPAKPVSLAAGTEVEISIPASPNESMLAQLARELREFPDNPDAPTDQAAQHDHYLYGTPKKE